LGAPKIPAKDARLSDTSRINNMGIDRMPRGAEHFQVRDHQRSRVAAADIVYQSPANFPGDVFARVTITTRRSAIDGKKRISGCLGQAANTTAPLVEQMGNCRRWDRGADQIALNLGALVSSQEIQIGSGLDTLRCGAHPEILGQSGDRPDNCARVSAR
jgi:hypothetical protein